jgi:predicted acylesterase/phospholipase RssA
MQITSARPARVPAPFLDPDVRIGLALSGGGYRAALLHAGVLHMIDSLGVPVSAISSVSGGSIVGAYYALGGDPADFLRAMVERRINLRRSLVHPWTVGRLVASSRILGSDYSVLPLDDYNRTSVQADLLDRVLFRGALHRASRTAADQAVLASRPELMLCMTDIAGNAMIGVTPHGFVEQSVSPAVSRFNFTSRGGLLHYGDFHDDTIGALPGTARLATLVAASGAFPGALKPLHVQMLRRLPLQPQVMDTSEMVLADGGMADNLGLVLLYTARHLARGYGGVTVLGVPPRFTEAVRKWNVDVVMASDGSAISVPRVPRSGFAEVSSAIDLVYRASAGEQLAGPGDNPPTTLLSPEDFLNVAGSPDSAALPFAYPGGSDTTRLLGLGGARTFAPPSYASLDPGDLAFLVRNIDSLDAPGRKVLLDAVAQIAARDGAQGNSRDRALRMGAVDSVVYRAIVDDLSDVLRVFVRTSTLNDQLSTHDAQALYRLGEYLFLFNKPYLAYNSKHARGTGGFSTGVTQKLVSDSAALKEAVLHAKQRIFMK